MAMTKKNRITQLELAITEFILEMDKVMHGPSTYERGMKIAGMITTLQGVLDDRGPFNRREP